MSEHWEERLQSAAEQIVMAEPVREQMLAKCMAKRSAAARRKMGCRVAAVVCFICLLLMIPLKIGTEENGISVVVYAAEGEGKWSRIEVGERRKVNPADEDENCYTFRLQLPENHLFEQEGIGLWNDYIHFGNDEIHWYTHEDSDYPQDGKASLRILILDDEGNRVDTLELEMSREGGERYVELRRVQ